MRDQPLVRGEAAGEPVNGAGVAGAAVVDIVVQAADVNMDVVAADQEIHPDRPELQSGGRWGVFAITAKQLGTANGAFGSYQAARCPFHAKSKITGCKKTIRIEGPSRADQARTLRRLLFCCSQASTCLRQRVDLAQPTGIELCPLDPVLLAAVVRQHPGRIQTDEELDATEAAAEDVEGPKRRGKGPCARAAKAKASAAQQPKSRGRGRGNRVVAKSSGAVSSSAGLGGAPSSSSGGQLAAPVAYADSGSTSQSSSSSSSSSSSESDDASGSSGSPMERVGPDSP